MDYVNWTYSKADGLILKSGKFNLSEQPAVKCTISLESDATLSGGTFTETVTNEDGGVIYGGVFLKNQPKQSARDDYEHKMKPFTIDDADYSNYSVNGVQLTSDTFYFCVGDAKQTIQVAYTGTNAAAIKGWQVTENETVNLAPGDSFTGYSNGPFTAAVRQDDAAVLDVTAYYPYLIGDSFKLKALTTRPLAKSEMKVYLKQKGASEDKTLLEPGADVNPWPEFPYVEQGYEMVIEPAGHVKNIDLSFNTKTEILDTGRYKVTVEFDKTEDHLGAEQVYYFYIVEPTYSVTVEGSGEARYSYYGTDTALGSTKVKKDTLITLRSTVDPDAEDPFIRWSFDKPDDITFTDEHGTELSADNVDLTQDTIYFKMPARNVKVEAVTTADPIPADGDSTSSDSGAGAIVAGTLLGGTAYLVGTHVWLNSLYGTVPANRQQLALALWEKAGKPAPASTVLFEDISADGADAQAAARWCTEQGLVKDYGETTFKPGRYVFRVQALKAWYDLQKLNG